MLALFTAVFLASVTFILVFLWKLPEDLKTRSIRPLFFLLLAIGFWVSSLPAMLAPENPVTITYAAYNVIEPNTTVFQYPAYTTNVISSLSVRTYNAFFYVWLIILTFLFFVLLIWWLNLLRQKAGQAMKEGSDVMKQLDERFK